MLEFRRFRGLIEVVLPAVLLTVSCSRSISVPEEGSTQDPPAPFQGARGSEGSSPVGSSLAARDNGAVSEDGLPFHDLHSVPAGTLLTVRLKEPITVGTAAGNGAFQGVLDHAVVIDGDTLVPRGATVVGRVESARTSKMKPDRGYVRLALEWIHVGGADLPVEAASLFARQTPSSDVPASTIQLEKGRRLTFRLTEPVSLSSQRAQASR